MTVIRTGIYNCSISQLRARLERIWHRLGMGGWISGDGKRLVFGKYPYTSISYDPIPAGPEYPSAPIGVYRRSGELRDEEKQFLSTRPTTRASWEVVPWRTVTMRPRWDPGKGRTIAGIETYEEADRETRVEFLDGNSPQEPLATYGQIGQPFEEFVTMLVDETREPDGAVELGEAAREEMPLSFSGGAQEQQPPVVGAWDTATVRSLLMASLDDVALDALCLDHFPEVYDTFGRGMRRDEKVNLLLDYCRHRPEEDARLSSLLRFP